MTTTYFTVIRQNEEVNATFFNSGSIFRLKEQLDHLGTNRNFVDLVFINTGSKAAAILEVNVIIFHLKPDGKDGCGYASAYRRTTFETDFKAVTIKPGEVATARVAMKPPKGNETYEKIEEYDNGWFKFPIAEENAGKQKFQMSICAEVGISTPTARYEKAMIPGFSFGLDGTSVGSVSTLQMGISARRYLDHCTERAGQYLTRA